MLHPPTPASDPEYKQNCNPPTADGVIVGLSVTMTTSDSVHRICVHHVRSSILLESAGVV